MSGTNWDRVPIEAQAVDAPLSRAAILLVERRRRDFEAKDRPYPKAPASFLDRDLIATKALKYQRTTAGVMWTKDEVDRFVTDNIERTRREREALTAKAATKGFAAELMQARARIVRAVAWRVRCISS